MRSREIKSRVRAFRFGKEGAENKVAGIENRYRKRNKGRCLLWVFVSLMVTYIYLVRLT
jgi:hypothetical protein